MTHFGYTVSNRGSVQMFRLLYVHQKRENFSPSLCLPSLQGSTHLSLILLAILSVSLLHSAVKSCPSDLAGKNRTYTTYTTIIEGLACTLCNKHTVKPRTLLFVYNTTTRQI